MKSWPKTMVMKRHLFTKMLSNLCSFWKELTEKCYRFAESKILRKDETEEKKTETYLRRPQSEIVVFLQ